MAELDGAGNLVARYVYAGRSTTPKLVLRGGQLYRVLTDQLGSARLVVNVNNSADVPFRADYEAFGAVIGSGLDWMPFGFAGGIYDADTKLVRFGARDYDAKIGHWVSKDPILFRGRQANLYVYVGNDPVTPLQVGSARAGKPSRRGARLLHHAVPADQSPDGGVRRASILRRCPAHANLYGHDRAVRGLILFSSGWRQSVGLV